MFKTFGVGTTVVVATGGSLFAHNVGYNQAIAQEDRGVEELGREEKSKDKEKPTTETDKEVESSSDNELTEIGRVLLGAKENGDDFKNWRVALGDDLKAKGIDVTTIFKKYVGKWKCAHNRWSKKTEDVCAKAQA